MSSITTIIVTYNRLELLKKCIAAVQNQTHAIDEIIVVNNGSTDGTGAWLDEQAYLTVIHQENLGGGGGFYTGIKAAYAKGYDWVWLMDDDGYPAQTCLAGLMAATLKRPEINAWGCLVLDSDNPRQLAFECPQIPDDIDEIDRTIEFVDNWAPFFNGTLLSKSTIKKTGYPNPGLFIWGDELDYYERVVQAGDKIASTTKAIFYHPKDRLYSVMYKGEYVYDGAMNWRAYCFFRNQAYLGRKYDNSTRTLILLTHFSYFYKKLPFGQFVKAVLLVLRAHWDGLNYNLSKKLPY